MATITPDLDPEVRRRSRFGRQATKVVLGLVVVSAVTLGVRYWEANQGPHDECGHDLSGYQTTVLALDPLTGGVVWSTDIPASSPLGRYDPASGAVRFVSLSSDRSWNRLDVETGKHLGSTSTDEPIIHETTTVPPADRANLVVDTAFRDEGVFVIATDSTTGGELWRVPAARSGGMATLQVQDLVIATSTDGIPVCA